MIFKREGRKAQDGHDATVMLPARTVLVAAGTTPNITYEKEAPGTFQLDAKKKFFQPHVVVDATATAGFICARTPNGFFTSYDADGRFVSYYGDNHPRYAGNVVKAMASAKDGFPHIVSALRDGAGVAGSGDAGARATRRGRRSSSVSTQNSSPYVEDVVRLTPTIVEVIVKAPAAARHFHPGQFYRLQNYESVARRVDGHTPLLMEGHRADRRLGRQGTGTAVADRARARRVEPARARICGRASTSSSWDRPARRPRFPSGQNVLLLGGGLGNAVLFSIAKAMRDARQQGDLFRRLQEGRGPVQARGDRGGDRSGDLEHRHRRGD